MQLRTGMTLSSVGLIFKSWNLNTGTAVMVTPEMNPSTIHLPLTLEEFGLGTFGQYSWIHPTDLPVEDPNFVTWLDKTKSQVTHNRTGEKCILRLNDSFPLDGSFTLTPMNGSPAVNKSSKEYTPAGVRARLEGLKGKEMIITMLVLAVVVETQSHSIIELTDYLRKKKQISIVFSSKQWLSLASLPISLVDLPMTERNKKKNIP